MRVIGLVMLLLLPTPTVEAQMSGKVHTIGLLSPPPGAYVAAFEEGLHQLGYVRGVNIVFETRSPGAGAQPLHEAVADLLRLNVEVIVTGPNPFIDAARKATASVPIVMVYGSDPINRGYISSLARPGGNITGLTWEPSPEILGKHVSSCPTFLRGCRVLLGSLILPRLSCRTGRRQSTPRSGAGSPCNTSKLEQGATFPKRSARSSVDAPERSSSSEAPSCGRGGSRSQTSRGRMRCRQSTCFEKVLTRVGSCPMGRT